MHEERKALEWKYVAYAAKSRLMASMDSLIAEAAGLPRQELRKKTQEYINKVYANENPVNMRLPF